MQAVQCKPVVRAQVSRKAVSVRAQAKEQRPAKINFAQAAAAVFTAAALMAAPVFAEDAVKVKQVVCASNPTAKLCLKNSFQPAK